MFGLFAFFLLFVLPFILFAGLLVYCFKTRPNLSVIEFGLFVVLAFVPIANIVVYIALSYWALEHSEKYSVYTNKFEEFLDRRIFK